ncbi:MAG: tetratricopeptide repeat protein [Pirellulales bacterium]
MHSTVDPTIAVPTRPTSRSTSPERVSRRRVLNVQLLGISLVVGLASLTAGYFWYHHQIVKTADILLKRAIIHQQAEEWAQSTSYFERYLMLRPADLDARVGMVESYAKSIQSSRGNRRLARLLYQVLGLVPNRDDLRLRLAEELLKIGDLKVASLEAKKLLASADHKSAAGRVIALVLYEHARREGSSLLINEAVQSLLTAIAGRPGDMKLAAITAQALHENPNLSVLQGENVAAQAESIIDRMVVANPKNVFALLTRYRYHRRFAQNRVAGSSSKRSDDLQQILKLDPDHIEALLLTVEDSYSKDKAKAQQILQHIIQIAPNDPRSYLMLAKMHSHTGEFQQAIQTLQQGRKTIGNKNSDLSIALGYALLQNNQPEKVTQVVNQLDLTMAHLLPTMSAVAGRRLENLIRSLRARQAIAMGESSLAIHDLKNIIISTKSGEADGPTSESLQAMALLARTMESMKRWDASAVYWDQLMGLLPQQAELLPIAAKTHLKLGQVDQAIGLMDRYQQLVSSEVDYPAQLLLVRAHLMRQKRLPAGQRNWSEFLAALTAAKQTVTTAVTGLEEPFNTKKSANQRTIGWELPLIEVDYLLTNQLVDNNSPGDSPEHQQSIELLKTAEALFDQEKRFWKGLIFAYLSLDQPDAAERAMAHYETLEQSLAESILVKSRFLASGNRYNEVEALLADSLDKLDHDQRGPVQLQRIQILSQAGQSEQALALTEQLVEQSPQDEDLLITGIQLALQQGDDAIAEHWELMLGKLDQVDDFKFNYLHSQRLLAKYDTLSRTARRDLSRLIGALRTERPNWYPGVVLAARQADRMGEVEQAVANYRKAVELGDKRAATLERLVSLLYQLGRYNEAQSYLTRLQMTQIDTSETDSLAISLAVQQNQIEKAMKIAKISIQQHPNDVMRYVWLASLQASQQKQEEAIKTMRGAVQRFSSAPQAWNGLFALLVRADQPEQARQILTDILSATGLDEATRHFSVAEGYLALGDKDVAQREYELAVKLEPENTTYRSGLARLLVSTDVGAATEQFELILKQDPSHADARRQLATLLAAVGDDASYERAVRLLQQGGQGMVDLRPDNRLRAALLARRGRTRQERLVNMRAATHILEQQLKQANGKGDDIDRVLLAGSYEQEALLSEKPDLLQASREQLRHLVDRAKPPAKYLQLYIDFLLRHISSPLDRSTTETPTNLSTAQKLEQVFLKDAAARLPDYQEALQREGAVSNLLPWVTLQVRLLMAEGQPEEAATAIEAYVAQEQDQLESSQGENATDAKAQLYLNVANLYTSIDRHERAVSWYRQLISVSPNAYGMLAQSLAKLGNLQEAAEVCIQIAQDDSSAQAAVVLAQLLTSEESDSTVLASAQATIAQALNNHSDNIGLLMSVAVMRASQGDNGGAIQLLRQIVALAPENLVALNNLATLLGEDPNGHSEALVTIERTMALAGRQPALLDTQGTIYLHAAKPKQAVASLEEAVAGNVSDPRYYFHLAAAYQATGQADSAAIALQKARDQGLDNTILTAGDQQSLSALDQQLSPVEFNN